MVRIMLTSGLDHLQLQQMGRIEITFNSGVELSFQKSRRGPSIENFSLG